MNRKCSMQRIPPQKLLHLRPAAFIRKPLLLRPTSIFQAMLCRILVPCRFWERSRCVDDGVEKAVCVEFEDGGVGVDSPKSCSDGGETCVEGFGGGLLGWVTVGGALDRGAVEKEEIAMVEVVELGKESVEAREVTRSGLCRLEESTLRAKRGLTGSYPKVVKQ